jgi:Protein of unknown function (DUF4245)
MVDTRCRARPPIRQDGAVEPAKPEPAAPAAESPEPAPTAPAAAPADAAVPAGGSAAAAADAAVPGAVESSPAPRGAEPLGQRAERSPRDMALSLAVLLVPIALLLLFYRLVLSGDAPASIDPAPTIQEAQAANVFPVAVPQRLGDDWHVSSATWRRDAAGATLRLGYVDPDGDPVQLVESTVALRTLVRQELTAKAALTGRYQAGARTWQRYDARPGEDALVLFEKHRTIIVVGRTATKNLETLAAALP